MLAFCSRPKPLVMKNLTPYLYLTLGREGIGRTQYATEVTSDCANAQKASKYALRRPPIRSVNRNDQE